MRFLRSLPIFIGLSVFAAAVPAQAGNAQTYTVELNKTEVLRLPGPASSIIVGNPQIADISVQSSDLLFVVGRGYGETNLIILDALGNTMMNADLQVVNTLSRHGVRLYNGKSRETYSCIPFCGPSPVLGDNSGFIGNNTSSADSLDSTSAFDASSSSAAPAGASQDNFASTSGGLGAGNANNFPN